MGPDPWRRAAPLGAGARGLLFEPPPDCVFTTFVTETGTVTAVAVDGTPAWRTTLRDAVEQGAQHDAGSLPVVIGHAAHVVVDGCRAVHVLDARTGRVLHEAEDMDRMWAVTDDLVVGGRRVEWLATEDEPPITAISLTGADTSWVRLPDGSAVPRGVTAVDDGLAVLLDDEVLVLRPDGATTTVPVRTPTPRPDGNPILLPGDGGRGRPGRAGRHRALARRGRPRGRPVSSADRRACHRPPVAWRRMRYGAVIPWATEREFTELAVVAEGAGWDMVFSWEAVWGQDAWATLAATAMVTERVRLGTLLTPAARYRPWDLASRVASVDRLSGGRATLGVGLGALHGNWLAFEPDEGRAVRAAKLDEVLSVYAGLMGGQPFEFTGEHFSARPVTELVPPPPVQSPHPPVWCVGLLVPGRSRQRSLERAARWQGVFPAVAGGSLDDPGAKLSLDTLREVVDRIGTLRADAGLGMEGYDVVVEGDSHGHFGSVRPPVQPWADAGATWWVESWWDLPDTPEGRAEIRRRLALGPHR